MAFRLIKFYEEIKLEVSYPDTPSTQLETKQ